MIIGTVIYTLLETFLRLIESGCVWVANKILDDAVTVFNCDQNIFVTFINLIPFAGTINLSTIVKGTSYGVVMLLMVTAIIRAFTSPLTGEDSINPAQSAIRAALTIILIAVVFGSGFGTGGSSISYSGLLGLVGRWFGATLSLAGSVPGRGLDNIISFNLNPVEYIAGILLELALLTSIIGAALQYVERIVSFAVYIIIGPVALAMYASRETENIARDWLMGVFSQFLAVLISLIMWIAFIESARAGDDSLLHFAVMIAILGIMRNSEKILSAFGLQTMRLGDSARAAIAGVGAITSTIMMGNALSRFVSVSRSHKAAAGALSGGGSIPGSVSAFNSSGTFASPASVRLSQAGKVITAMNPVAAIRNASAQNRAISSVNSAMSSGTSINASTLNTALGLSSSTAIHAVGNGEGSIMKPAKVATDDGRTVQGFVGDAAYNKGGQIEVLKDAFFATSSDPSALSPGSPLQFMPDYHGTARFINGGGPVFDVHGNHVYRTSFENPDISFAEARQAAGENLHPEENAPVKEIVHEARNI